MKFDSKTQIITFETTDPLQKFINEFQPRARTSLYASQMSSTQNTIELSSLLTRLETVLNPFSTTLPSFPATLKVSLTLMWQIMTVIVWQLQNDKDQIKLIDKQELNALLKCLDVSKLQIDSIDDQDYAKISSFNQVSYNRTNPIGSFKNIYEIFTKAYDRHHARRSRSDMHSLNQRHSLDSHYSKRHEGTRPASSSQPADSDVGSSSHPEPRLEKTNSLQNTRKSGFTSSFPFFSQSSRNPEHRDHDFVDIELQTPPFERTAPPPPAARPVHPKLRPIFSAARRLVDNGLHAKQIANLFYCYAHPPFFSFTRRHHKVRAHEIFAHLYMNPQLSTQECIAYIRVKTNSLPINKHGTLNYLLEKIMADYPIEDNTPEPTGFSHRFKQMFGR
ncbi:hypothetical protein [Legionella sp. CNM-4043-24]|uniref:hypothetical protein n=1 Tax=Legionella sp. CNM-4043-24 TaxID=3421646 RepID=UPI00403AEE65